MRGVAISAGVVGAVVLTVAIRAGAQSLPTPPPFRPVQTVTLAGERVAAEVTGLSGGTVVVSGTVGLSAATLASIAGPTCVPSDIIRIAVGATPTLIPVISSTRTEVTIRNVSVGAISLSCRPDISGLGDLPDCDTPGYGLTINPVESVTFSYRASVAIRCRTCPAGGGVVEHMEVSCTG